MEKQHVFFVKNTISIRFFSLRIKNFDIFSSFTSEISFPRVFICVNFKTVVQIPSIGKFLRTFERYDGDNVSSPLAIRT